MVQPCFVIQVPSGEKHLPELLWYMGRHPDKDGEPNGTTDGSQGLCSIPPTTGCAKGIEWLLDTDSR